MLKKKLIGVGAVFLWGVGMIVPAWGHGTIPQELKRLEPGKVQGVIGRDFLIPRQFSQIPGPVFYLNHQKELGLSIAQTRKMILLARRIMLRARRQGAVIDREKRLYLKALGKTHPDLSDLSKRLERIAELSEKATFDHLKGHLACREILTPAQREKAMALEKSVSSMKGMK